MNKESVNVKCASCNLRGLCMPLGLNDKEYEWIDELITTRIRIPRGKYLFRNGDKFNSLYAVRSGFFKACVATEDGREQVTSFQMAGEILGLDGIIKNEYSCDVIALEDAEVCVIPYTCIEKLSQEIIAFQHHMYKIMSREIVRNNSAMLLLGSMRAEERVATFLLDIGHRLQTRGFSETEIVLRMTREEIGSYLGIKLETVSRTFSKFSRDGMLAVKQRHIHIQKIDELKRIANPQRCH